jgi:hypothetical protein
MTTIDPGDNSHHRYTLTPGVFALLLLCIAGCSPTDSATSDSPNLDTAEFDENGVLQIETDRYSINLRMPQYGNPAALSDIRSFLQLKVDQLSESVRDEPEPGYFETHQYELAGDWETAESDYLYTFIVRGHAYTGGAHAMPFVKTFTYSKADDQRVALEALLQGDDSLAKISAMATDHFSDALPAQMAEAGLSPDWSNWRIWFVSNNRISFIFPVYQIAPYSEGEQLFSVMVDAGTRQLFNPDYFDVYEP